MQGQTGQYKPNTLIHILKLVVNQRIISHCDSQFDSQHGLQQLSMAYFSGRSCLDPSAYFHISLQQGSDNDEVLDLILDGLALTVN
jgi:hypothetical protein